MCTCKLIASMYTNLKISQYMQAYTNCLTPRTSPTRTPYIFWVHVQKTKNSHSRDIIVLLKVPLF